MNISSFYLLCFIIYMAYIKKKTIRNRKNKQKGLKHKGFGAGDKVRTKINYY